jgi:hypothetical protein
MKQQVFSWLIKIRNRILKWIATSDQITGLNKSPEWDAANVETILFHWIMKNPLRQAVKLMPDIPQPWLDGLTGTQRILYEIGKEKWYDCDKSQNRIDQFWKPFCYALVLWQHDEVMEPFDRLFYEVLAKRDDFFIRVDRLDPDNWYMDDNPKITPKPHIGSQGRCQRIEMEDPAVRYDTLMPDKVIVLEERPARNFVCLRKPNGALYYVMINRHKYIQTVGGGYGFAVIGRHDVLLDAIMAAQKIEELKE